MQSNDSQTGDSEQASRLEVLADEWLAGNQPAADASLARLKHSSKHSGEHNDELTLEELLDRLVGAPAALGVHHFALFSDLTREETALVRRQWTAIPVERRREVARYLVDLAEEDLALRLGRFLRLTLADPDSETRRIAIEGLWEETETDLIGPLVQILHNDDDFRTRASAAAALGAYVLAGELEEIDSSLAMRAEEALLSVALRESEPVTVRSSALESLAYSGEVGIRQLIEDAYYAPEEEMRVSALNAMGRSADVRWRGLARAELQNPDATMRAAAARACGELEAKAALDELTDLVSDDDVDVRIAAILALGRIGGKDARELLETVRLSDDPDEVDAADFALEELMFLSEVGVEGTLLEEGEDAPEEWDIEPWHRGFDADDLDFGLYE